MRFALVAMLAAARLDIAVLLHQGALTAVGAALTTVALALWALAIAVGMLLRVNGQMAAAAVVGVVAHLRSVAEVVDLLILQHFPVQ